MTQTLTPTGTVRAGGALASGLRAVGNHTAAWIFGADVLLIVVMSLASAGHRFWSTASFQNMASDSAQALLLATGVALMLGAGELDISLGANLVLSSVAGGEITAAIAGSSGGHMLLAAVAGMLVCMAAGACIGLVNAVVITRLKVNSLIATLAMLGIATGVADIVTGGSDLSDIPQNIQPDFGIRAIAGIPLPAFIALAVWLVTWLAVSTTRWGLRLVALGSSRDAAMRAGLKVQARLTSLFALVGGFAGLAGFMDLSRFATTNIGGHGDDALAAITAAVIGGTSLFGGRISMPGVLAGTVLAVVLQDGLVILGLSAFYQLVAVGVVLIIAVYIDQRRRPLRGGLFRRT
jgi:ribose transport system permease protein